MSSQGRQPDGYSRVERVMDILRWLWFFVYVQFLFAAGTLAGLVVGGIFPAFFAAVAVARRFTQQDPDDFATRRFARLYRKMFWKSQQIGWTTVVILLVCTSNVIYFNQLQTAHPWAYGVKVLWLAVTSVIATTLFVVAPTFVDYALPLRELPRLCLAGLGNLRALSGMAFGVACLGAGVIYQTGLFLYLMLGIFIFLVAACNGSFERRSVVSRMAQDGAMDGPGSR